jgi:trehalose 6-phosphate phosphatase
MNELLFPAMRQVGEQIQQSPRLLFALDYDGALTAIVDNPAEASLASPMREVLWLLAGRPGVSLAVVGGRTAADLQQRVGIDEAIYVGNHGLEIRSRAIDFVEPAAAARVGALRKLAADLQLRLASIAGVLIEDNGLTLSIHYRRVAAPDRENVWRIVYAACDAARDQFELTIGNKVYEVRPSVPWNKGEAVNWIRNQLGREGLLTVYVGDDATDEDVFTTLADAVTIKIGDFADSAARYLLAGPAEVQQFLEWVDVLLSEKT